MLQGRLVGVIKLENFFVHVLLWEVNVWMVETIKIVYKNLHDGEYVITHYNQIKWKPFFGYVNVVLILLFKSIQKVYSNCIELVVSGHLGFQYIPDSVIILDVTNICAHEQMCRIHVQQGIHMRWKNYGAT